ncbi:MAG TPA: sigma 54-interacting transcriptional regulator [Haliangiales bacterium]|nr:sigma 54-interacting transcriptional regulator [Haliangiales bacterium]
MTLPRVVVVEGPDVGGEFAIGPEGGGIGRGEGNAVKLTDLAVSRQHCALRFVDGALHVEDAGSRNRTLVNDRPIASHRLVDGDTIKVGNTLLAYLPPEGGVAVLPLAPVSRVTIEVSKEELLRAKAARGAARHLTQLVRLGDGLRRGADRPAFLRLSCEVTREALGADRVVVLLPDGSRRLAPVAVAGGDDSAQLALKRDFVDRATRGSAILLGPDALGGPRMALAAPIDDGLLYAEKALPGGSEPTWGETDVVFCACVAHFCAAGLESLAAREALQRENRALEERLGGGRELVGKGPVTQKVLSFVAKVAPTDSTVLLLGESGSGKEMVASAIHYASRRAREPFIAVSCAALTETLLESELFGHEKGSFTGATEKKLGRFELADRGTLFLDEVGELTPRCQTKLLRVLEERRFERVGGTKTISADVRVIAATNRDLKAMVGGGAFREDLYYRLSVIQTEVPPLRARRDDIQALAEHFLEKLRFQTGRRVHGFSPEAMRALLAYHWPGNVRELRNAVERALVLGEAELVRLEDLPHDVAVAAPHAAAAPPTAPSAFVVPRGATPPPAPPASLRELEKQGILAALAQTNGNKAQAAAILQIDRSTLYKKLKEYGIEA